MKNIWTLIVKTTLPESGERQDELVTDVEAFENFDEAKAALRKKLRKIAFSENKMFDGKGHIIRLENYPTDDDESEEWDDDVITKSLLKKVSRSFKNIFSGKDTTLKIAEGFYTDWMIAFDYNNGVIRFHGDDDGPCNGYDPVIYTNMFDMSEEKDYFMYIEDLLGQDEYASQLCIDLKKTVLKQSIEG